MRYIHSLKPVFSMGHVVSKNMSCKEVHLHTQKAIQFYMSYISLVRGEQQNVEKGMASHFSILALRTS